MVEINASYVYQKRIVVDIIPPAYVQTEQSRVIIKESLEKLVPKNDRAH